MTRVARGASGGAPIFESQWCRAELGAASGAGIPIIPVYNGDTTALNDVKAIINGDTWEHGFWGGTVSFARLIDGLAVTNETVRDHVDMDSDEEPMTAAELRASAHEDYPMLDS